MWIRSQYKSILVNAKRIFNDNLEYCEKTNDGTYIRASNNDYNDKKVWVIKCFDNEEVWLGVYSTKEKAMKVLDMIEDCLKDNFERGMYEPCIEFYERGVFKMPKDDEVE